MIRLLDIFKRNPTIVLAYLLAVVMVVIVSVLRPGFGSITHLRSLAIEASVIGLVALGQTLVIISGGIDLSIPWVLNSAAVLMTVFTRGQDSEMVWAIPLVLMMAAAIGLINGLAIAFLDITPVIMTLAMNGILLGIMAGIASGGLRIGYERGAPPPIILGLARNRILELPAVVWIWLCFILLATILFSYSGFGRRLYAIGNNSTAALFSGINVRGVRMLTYVLSAVMSAIAGIILAGKFGRAYLGMGEPFLFGSVAAVVVGGASILGGSGHYVGTVAGALILTVLTALLPIFKLPAAAQNIVYGLVVLITVYLAGLSRRERES
jgi:ribose transport system permease protein